MAKFKVGDRVKRIRNGDEDIVTYLPGMYKYDQNKYAESEEGMVLEINSWVYQKNWELINESNNNMTLKQKFTNLFITEPKKSLIKAGLMDLEGIATDDGVKVYVGYQMMKDATFKSEVVDVLVAEESK